MKGAPGCGILYSNHRHNRLECFTDADCVFVGGNLVSVSRSSAESEYKAMTQSTCEIMWLHQLLGEVGIKTSILAKLWCDNQTALYIAFNLVFHEQTQHMEIDCHFLCEKIQLGLISTGCVKSGEQLSDIFTNALSGDRVSYLCNKLDMINIYPPT